MTQFKLIFYIVLGMAFLLVLVFLWGAFTYKRVKSDKKFLNKPLLLIASPVGVVTFILSWIPIFMKIWTYDDDIMMHDPIFISILVFEFIFLIGFFFIVYFLAYDFGITLDQEADRLQFFGQTINSKRIIELEEKKHCLKIVYEQGFKNIKKKIPVYSSSAKKFIREVLTEIIAQNQLIKEQELKSNLENETIINNEKPTEETIAAVIKDVSISEATTKTQDVEVTKKSKRKTT